jgi:3-dehydroquinate synthase
MVMAADLSKRLGFMPEAEAMRIKALVRAAELPVVAPDLGHGRWLELMQVDKKNEGGQIKFILLKPLGTPMITTVPTETLLATIDACTGRS